MRKNHTLSQSNNYVIMKFLINLFIILFFVIYNYEKILFFFVKVIYLFDNYQFNTFLKFYQLKKFFKNIIFDKTVDFFLEKFINF